MIEALEAEVISIADKFDVRVLKLTVAGTETDPELRVIVDTPEGVTIGAISRMSKAVRRSEAVESYFETDRFRLEVTSPGVGYGLREPWQFPRYVGKNLKIMLASGEAANTDDSSIVGKLTESTESGLEIDTPDGKKSFDWNEIDQAVVLTDW